VGRTSGGWRLTQPRRGVPFATRTFCAEVRAVAPIRRCLVAFSACSHTDWGTGGHGGVSCGAPEDTDLELSRRKRRRRVARWRCPSCTRSSGRSQRRHAGEMRRTNQSHLRIVPPKCASDSRPASSGRSKSGHTSALRCSCHEPGDWRGVGRNALEGTLPSTERQHRRAELPVSATFLRLIERAITD